MTGGVGRLRDGAWGCIRGLGWGGEKRKLKIKEQKAKNVCGGKGFYPKASFPKSPRVQRVAHPTELFGVSPEKQGSPSKRSKGDQRYLFE